MINYKFREDELIEEFKRYIDSTYSGHYGQGGLQSSEIIVDRGHGMGFFSGNIDKYNDRYGKKGDSPDDWRKDIMKTIHYGFLKLFEHDRVHSKKESEEFTLNFEYQDIELGDEYTVSLVDLGPALSFNDTVDITQDVDGTDYKVTMKYDGLKV